LIVIAVGNLKIYSDINQFYLVEILWYINNNKNKNYDFLSVKYQILWKKLCNFYSFLKFFC